MDKKFRIGVQEGRGAVDVAIFCCVALLAVVAAVLIWERSASSGPPLTLRPTLPLVETPVPTQGLEQADLVATDVALALTATAQAQQLAETSTATPPLCPAKDGGCDPLAVTNLQEREDAWVNGTGISLQVRDTNQCGRPLWYNESGIAEGANYAFDLPEGWVAVTASVSAQVHPDGGSATDYTGGPVIVVFGPWQGAIGLYEGAVRVYPEEWVQNALDSEVMPIQRAQVGNPNLQPIRIP
jgi:hypothetical protein